MQNDDTELLRLFDEVVSRNTGDLHAPVTSSMVYGSPIRACDKAAAVGRFQLRLALHKGRQGEVERAHQVLELLDTLLGPFVGTSRTIEIDEYSYGQYARFALEVDTRAGTFRVMKTMYGRTWSIAQEGTLQAILAFVQQHVFVSDDDSLGVSDR